MTQHKEDSKKEVKGVSTEERIKKVAGAIHNISLNMIKQARLNPNNNALLEKRAIGEFLLDTGIGLISPGGRIAKALISVNAPIVGHLVADRVNKAGNKLFSDQLKDVESYARAREFSRIKEQLTESEIAHELTILMHKASESNKTVLLDALEGLLEGNMEPMKKLQNSPLSNDYRNDLDFTAEDNEVDLNKKLLNNPNASDAIKMFVQLGEAISENKKLNQEVRTHMLESLAERVNPSDVFGAIGLTAVLVAPAAGAGAVIAGSSVLQGVAISNAISIGTGAVISQLAGYANKKIDDKLAPEVKKEPVAAPGITGLIEEMQNAPAVSNKKLANIIADECLQRINEINRLDPDTDMNYFHSYEKMLDETKNDLEKLKEFQGQLNQTQAELMTRVKMECHELAKQVKPYVRSLENEQHSYPEDTIDECLTPDEILNKKNEIECIIMKQTFADRLNNAEESIDVYKKDRFNTGGVINRCKEQISYVNSKVELFEVINEVEKRITRDECLQLLNKKPEYKNLLGKEIASAIDRELRSTVPISVNMLHELRDCLSQTPKNKQQLVEQSKVLTKAFGPEFVSNFNQKNQLHHAQQAALKNQLGEMKPTSIENTVKQSRGPK